MAESVPDLNRNASLKYMALEEKDEPSALEQFGTKGLTSAQAAAQLEKWGRNEIPEEKEPLWRMFAMQFVGTMPAMIEIAMILSAILGSWYAQTVPRAHAHSHTDAPTRVVCSRAGHRRVVCDPSHPGVDTTPTRAPTSRTHHAPLASV
jgi:magnesium-transporting ATPase (P-type)